MLPITLLISFFSLTCPIRTRLRIPLVCPSLLGKPSSTFLSRCRSPCNPYTCSGATVSICKCLYMGWPGFVSGIYIIWFRWSCYKKIRAGPKKKTWKLYSNWLYGLYSCVVNRFTIVFKAAAVFVVSLRIVLRIPQDSHQIPRWEPMSLLGSFQMSVNGKELERLLRFTS